MPRLERNPGRPAGLSLAKNAAIALSKSRSACCCTEDDPSASHGSAARASASCRCRSAGPGAAPRPGHHQDCCSTARFHTYRACAQCRSRMTASASALGYARFRTAMGQQYRWPMTFPEDYRRGRHVVSALHVHLVFVTKYRRGVLDADMLSCCKDAMRKVCEDFGA